MTFKYKLGNMIWNQNRIKRLRWTIYYYRSNVEFLYLHMIPKYFWCSIGMITCCCNGWWGGGNAWLGSFFWTNMGEKVLRIYQHVQFSLMLLLGFKLLHIGSAFFTIRFFVSFHSIVLNKNLMIHNIRIYEFLWLKSQIFHILLFLF